MQYVFYHLILNSAKCFLAVLITLYKESTIFWWYSLFSKWLPSKFVWNFIILLLSNIKQNVKCRYHNMCCMWRVNCFKRKMVTEFHMDIILSIHICSLHEQLVSVTMMAFHLAATVCYHMEEVMFPILLYW